MTRIGVTGHRILAEIDKINQGIDISLNKIEESLPAPFTIISSLAEGADQLVAERALKQWPECSLFVPLPLPIPIYQEQFSNAEVLATFNQLLSAADEISSPPETKDLPDAYLQAGQEMLEMSDVLIAIWDGEPAQGTGGTGDIVVLARERGIPLVWIHAGNRQPETNKRTSLGADQGKVSFEGF
ncbi:MAG: VWA domain-containing protein [Anaerolineaceae bacterium]|nr:VWA domain-containing protein [Anaerolineaceae bacterium]